MRIRLPDRQIHEHAIAEQAAIVLGAVRLTRSMLRSLAAHAALLVFPM